MCLWRRMMMMGRRRRRTMGGVLGYPRVARAKSNGSPWPATQDTPGGATQGSALIRVQRRKAGARIPRYAAARKDLFDASHV